MKRVLTHAVSELERIDKIEKQAKKEELEYMIKTIKKNDDWDGDDILSFIENELKKKYLGK